MSAEFDVGNQGTIRVAVVGNSNSIGPTSYTGRLASLSDVTVTNRSIGATPNVVLLDFLAREKEWNYDFVIIETAVVDSLQQDLYPYECSWETLELAVRAIRAVSNAQIILLIIPTRHGLLVPKMHWQRSLYNKAAVQFGLPILDGFALVSDLVGREKFARIDIFAERAKAVIAAFRLPDHFFEVVTWRFLREREIVTNAMGMFAFSDGAHFTAALHILVSRLLYHFMTVSKVPNNARASGERADLQDIVTTSDPEGGDPVVRSSSLLSRTLSLVHSGATVRYQCPAGFRPFGLLVNEANTSGYVCLNSPAGATIFDMRFPARPTEWRAVIAQILDFVGGGDIGITVVSDRPSEAGTVHPRPGAGFASPTAVVELGELILVRTDWADMLPLADKEIPPSVHIEDAAWAGTIVEEAAAPFNIFSQGLDQGGRFIDTRSSDFIAAMLSRTDRPAGFADQARLLLLAGITDKAVRLLEDACGLDPDDLELKQMLAGLRALKADVDVPPETFLERARTMLRSGDVPAAEALLVEGMARFASNAEFYFNYAWIPCNRRDWTEGLQRWQLFYDRFPDHVSGYTGLAMCLKETGRLAEADTLLAAATLRFPSAVEPALRHAELAEAMGNRAESIRRLTAVRDRFPDNTDIGVRLSRAFTEQGRDDAALQEAHTLFLRGEIAEARARTEMVLERSPNSIQAVWLLNEIYLRQEKVPEAIILARKLVELAPTDLRTREHLVRLLAVAGQLEEARSRAEAILTEVPDHLTAVRLMGEIAGRQRRFPEAIAWIRKVIAVNLADIGSREYLTRLLVVTGSLDEARTEAETILAMAPGHDAVTRLLNHIEARADILARWKARHFQLAKDCRAANPNLAFLGDSITEQWQHTGRAFWETAFQPLGAFNAGIAGETIDGLLWRLRHGAVNGINPSCAVLLIGTNDVPSAMIDEIVDGIRSVVQCLLVRLPRTKILLLGILPRDPSPDAPVREKIKRVNKDIAQVADGARVSFLDVGNLLLEADGTLSAAVSPDGLHLSSEGYARWAEPLRRWVTTVIVP
jgi:tetratricopeptide (TPR) repeat protein/lysophospholipase L1-like esterase